MRPSLEGAQHGLSTSDTVSHQPIKAASLQKIILECLDDAKAENIITIDLQGKSSIGDIMVIASGRSQRHVGAIADQVSKKLKDAGYGKVSVEGFPHCDWVLIDASDVIVHLFRPEVREFYNLEKMWQADRPTDQISDNISDLASGVTDEPALS